MRRKYPTAGGEKLRWHLEQKYRLGPWPSTRTIARWLKAAGVVQPRKRRSRPGPIVPAPARSAARLANDVWTVDFKGWFRTGDGKRVFALTVRDLATRYVLLVRHVAQSDERRVGAVLRQLFRRYGLPRAIRVDNGPPFGGVGPRGWSRLAVGWIRLGVKVEYGRPGCPQDNAAHEQMHRVLKQETAAPPAVSLPAQQRRFDRWRLQYNQRRPHRSLNLQVPHALYRARQPSLPPRWTYPKGWRTIRTDPRGRVRWEGRKRVIGRALGNELLALKSIAPGIVEVYFGPHLLGELHARDHTSIRAVHTTRRPRNRMPIH
jgi:transposase InsO family protein